MSIFTYNSQINTELCGIGVIFDFVEPEMTESRHNISGFCITVISQFFFHPGFRHC